MNRKQIFLFTSLLSILLMGCANEELPLTPNLITEVNAIDVDNNGNSSDIRIEFKVKDNINVIEYRVFVVPAIDKNDFNAGFAYGLPKESYLEKAPDKFKNEYIFGLPEGLLDINGNQIANNIDYQVSVLVVGTGNLQLAPFSDSFVLLDIELIISEGDYLIFGSYFGLCTENCVQIFKLESDKLLDDINDQFSFSDFYIGNFALDLGQEKFDQVKDLINYVPNKLLVDPNMVFGGPDAADQGGIYFEIKLGELHDNWLMDYRPSGQFPDYLKELVTKIKEKIAIINN